MNPPSQPAAWKRHAGFTLTEVLVVIAIIATLLALLFPVLGLATQKSGAAQSASNLRQLGVAMLAFAGEHGGAFPPAAIQTTTAEGTWENLGSWDSYLLKYLGVDVASSVHAGHYSQLLVVEDLFSHPRDESEIVSPGRVRRGYSMVTGGGMVGQATWSGSGWYPSARIASVPSPASTLLITEKAGYLNNVIGRTGIAGLRSITMQTAYQPDLNPGGKFNYLFCDGHVELLHPDETIGNGSYDNPEGFWTLDPSD